jgi:hypothetical protein
MFSSVYFVNRRIVPFVVKNFLEYVYLRVTFHEKYVDFFLQVYFVSDLADTQPTIDQSRFTPIDETGDCGIYYPIKAEWIRRETEKLLRNFCPFCAFEFETFEILRDHVRRTHRYFYCDLCVEHLNLFPHERKCYTRHDLVQHIRCGDRDDTSFKGHPLCRFCDDHFLDVDQLYQHMRKEHYFCHLCTSDNVYYRFVLIHMTNKRMFLFVFSDFDLLREHYRTSHYFCEIDQCKDVQFTNVFASEIDFRAHQASQHSKNRAQARQFGTIPMEFQSSSVRDRKQQRDPVHRGKFIFQRILYAHPILIFKEYSRVENLIHKEITIRRGMNGTVFKSAF